MDAPLLKIALESYRINCSCEDLEVIVKEMTNNSDEGKVELQDVLEFLRTKIQHLNFSDLGSEIKAIANYLRFIQNRLVVPGRPVEEDEKDEEFASETSSPITEEPNLKKFNDLLMNEVRAINTRVDLLEKTINENDLECQKREIYKILE
eukprot:UN23025